MHFFTLKIFVVFLFTKTVDGLASLPRSHLNHRKKKIVFVRERRLVIPVTEISVLGISWLTCFHMNTLAEITEKKLFVTNYVRFRDRAAKLS